MRKYYLDDIATTKTRKTERRSCALRSCQPLAAGLGFDLVDVFTGGVSDAILPRRTADICHRHLPPYGGALAHSCGSFFRAGAAAGVHLVNCVGGTKRTLWREGRVRKTWYCVFLGCGD